jgi:hypothetical protein
MAYIVYLFILFHYYVIIPNGIYLKQQEGSPSSIVTNAERISPDAPMAAFRIVKVGNREFHEG